MQTIFPRAASVLRHILEAIKGRLKYIELFFSSVYSSSYTHPRIRRSSTAKGTDAVREGQIMRKRSRLEARMAAGRTSFQRYLFYSALVLLSLALPAILTLRGDRQPLLRNESVDGGTTISVDVSKQTDLSEVPPPKTGPVSVSRWQGIAEGIPSEPRSVHDIHLVFSTDCSPYQNFQSIILFHSAEVRHGWDGAECGVAKLTEKC